MKTLEWTTIDKSSWPRGEWDSEPDKKQWLDEATGLPCLIVRGPSGALCGYVGVPDGHPLFEKDYSSADVSVHGGLTFADHCCPHEDGEGRGICHVVEPGEADNVWWLGFDCAHSGDVWPRDRHGLHDAWSRYRDWHYVARQVESLAKQLAAISA